MSWEVWIMRLKTSFCNGRVVWKNLTRFAPVWVLYSVAEVLGLMLTDTATYGRIAGDLNDIMGPVAIFHGFYALIVAACLFGDLFDSRLCNGLHAMPMRRSGWLLTNLVSGLVFALIPAIVGGAVGAVLLGNAWWMALLWQGTSLLQFLFFFGLAVFSAMCAGKRMGMVAIYTILNFLSILIYWIITMIYEPLLPGVVISDTWFVYLCPVVSIASDNYVNFNYNSVSGGFGSFNPEAWNYLFICTGVGVVLMLASWLLYRRRNLESAGDFVSFRPMRMFFLVFYTFVMGMLLYSFGELFGLERDYGFLVVGIMIGWFTGWMLLERTVKIFTGKVFLGFTIFVALFAGSIGLTIVDFAGIASYVPETEKIETAVLYLGNDNYAYSYQQGYTEDGWWLTEQEEFTKMQDLHRKIMAQQDKNAGQTITVKLHYLLSNGSDVMRNYEVPADSAVAEELRVYFSDIRVVFGTDKLELLKENIDSAHVYITGTGSYDGVELTDPQQIQSVLDAIEADCQVGAMAQYSYFHKDQEYYGSIDLSFHEIDSNQWGSIYRGEYVDIYRDCNNVIAALETLGVISVKS